LESGFYSVVMLTVYFLWSLCVFELTAFHTTLYWYRITTEFFTQSAVKANTQTVLIADICVAVCSISSRVQSPKC
jgi:hypothetical protein